jgi:hypothetical protein
MSEITYATSHVCVTELGRINQLAASVATKFLKLDDTTLNAKYGVKTNFQIKTYPRIRYFGIGIRGCACISSESGIMQPYVPSPSNMDLYQPIPFRCVPISEAGSVDLSKYRMLKVAEIGGTKYLQCWLKLLEFETDTPKLTSIANGKEQSWTMDTSNLYPTPVALNPTDVSSSIGIRTEVSVTAIRRVTGAEVCEVMKVMYGGDLRKARISEMGLYSGIETTNQISDINSGASFAEAGYVQLATHMCTVGHDLSDEKAVLEERCVIQNGALIQL